MRALGSVEVEDACMPASTTTTSNAQIHTHTDTQTQTQTHTHPYTHARTGRGRGSHGRGHGSHGTPDNHRAHGHGNHGGPYHTYQHHGPPLVNFRKYVRMCVCVCVYCHSWPCVSSILSHYTIHHCNNGPRVNIREMILEIADTYRDHGPCGHLCHDHGRGHGRGHGLYHGLCHGHGHGPYRRTCRRRALNHHCARQ
jgi:hypothetical protein